MSEIVKTEAIILRKIDFGDTSRIYHLFTKDYGKLSAIAKGVRSPKSKIGAILDNLNYVQLVLYKKETRDIQLIKEVELIKYFSLIPEDINRMQFASSLVELLYNLTVENEDHKKLFSGSIRALDLINDKNSSPKLIFAKYFLFFIKEIGYEFSIDRCSVCKNEINQENTVAYNNETGILCSVCSEKRIVHSYLSKELFNLLFCLSSKKNNITYNQSDLNKVIFLLEKYLRNNIQEFKGLKSLEIIKS